MESAGEEKLKRGRRSADGKLRIGRSRRRRCLVVRTTPVVSEGHWGTVRGRLFNVLVTTPGVSTKCECGLVVGGKLPLNRG